MAKIEIEIDVKTIDDLWDAVGAAMSEFSCTQESDRHYQRLRIWLEKLRKRVERASA